MEKTFIATQKYLIMSPRKIRLVTDLIRKMKPSDAILKLPFVQKRAADYVSKVIKNAMASAKNAGVSETDLIFKEIQVGQGPTLKRGRAASRGRWAPIQKKMAHIRIILTTKAKPVAKVKKAEVKVEEVKTKPEKTVKAKVEKVEKETTK